MRRTLSVAEGVAWRTLHNVFTNPSLVIHGLDPWTHERLRPDNGWQGKA